MSQSFELTIGQCSDKGAKAVNQDFHGMILPQEPALSLKGAAIALADGISSSEVSQIASESAVKSFLTDYYCTPDSWTVKTSAQRVIAAANSWLNAQTRQSRYADDRDRGYVCTFTAMVFKSRSAHIFHVGDARVYRVSGQALEQLTEDHRVVVSSQQSYLGRALGVDAQVEIDCLSVPLQVGDLFFLATDGVYEHVDVGFVINALASHADDLDAAAKLVVGEALARGSEDNLTCQLVRVDGLPDGAASDFADQAAQLPLPPLLEARMAFDGYTIIRQIHASSRSHLYLAAPDDGGAPVVIKIPSIDLRDDPEYLRRFMMEEWIARRIDSAYVVKTAPQNRPRHYLYVVSEFIDGQTLTQWMRDNPAPDLETVRAIVEQIAKGLRAFHRLEMVHQDLRPENVMIDKTGTVKIIDFGAAKVAGIVEAEPLRWHDDILGTVQYAAPEYFIGQSGSWQSDMFSLGVMTYQMLTGRLPYGAEIAKCTTRAQQKKLRYQPASDATTRVPVWVDGAIRKSIMIDPAKRYEAMSEFLYDLRTPNPGLSNAAHMPLSERNPLLFWKSLSVGLGCLCVYLFVRLMS